MSFDIGIDFQRIGYKEKNSRAQTLLNMQYPNRITKESLKELIINL